MTTFCRPRVYTSLRTVIPMTVTVYADLYAIINFVFDTLMLCLTCRITGTPAKAWRILLASAAGTGYAFFSLCVANIFPLHPVAAVLICAAAFGLKRLPLNACVYIASSALTGGLVYGAFYLAGKDEGYISEIGGGAVAVCVLSAAAITAGYMFVCRSKKSSGAVSAYITVLGSEYKAFLMRDSGNLVTDPLSLDPVIIVSCRVFGDLFKSFDPTSPPLPIRAIPIRTAAGSDILYGFRPQKCCVREFGRKKRREVRAIIAITGKTLFSGTYDGLMPPI